MSWYSIREYTERMGVSMSTVRRQIQEGRLFAKKFGRHWYIQPQEIVNAPGPEPRMEESLMDFSGASLAKDGGNVASIVEFSSKALHHYLLMSEKLIAEKDARLAERDQQIAEKKQEVADLERYVQLLEGELTRKKEKPDGWQ
jgi:excisionase family DNA binding protein